MISICVPTYNRLSYLKKCVDSILDKFKDYPYEVIIADGGSTDGTLEYLRNINHDNVTIIEQGSLIGEVKTLNICFKKSKGDYVYWCNDDMALFPEIFIKACKLMDKEKDIGIVAPKQQETRFGNLFGISWRPQYWLLISRTHIFRASVLREINYLDETFRHHSIDIQSFLDVMSLDCSTIFTRDLASIHWRARDKKWDGIREKKLEQDRKKKGHEAQYFDEKRKTLKKSCRVYMRNKNYQKIKYRFCNGICSKMFRENASPFFSNLRDNHNALAAFIYDKLLEKAIVFQDKRYRHLKDFYLAQKFPDKIIKQI